MKPSLRKKTAVVTIAAIIYQMVAAPASLYALTSGPTQPEFSKFEPVSGANMVNPLTGQFTYNLPVVNIPGPNGSGYSLSLSYHSGVSPDEEASWVGYGWTLNPGAVTRNKQGFPDDYNGEEVRYWNKTIPNRTYTVGIKASTEAFSFEPLSSFGANLAYRYNNYKGSGFVAGISTNVKGLGSLNLSVDDQDGASFSPSISPSAILSSLSSKDAREGDQDQTKANEHDRGKYILNALANSGHKYAQYGLGSDVRPTHFHPYSGLHTNVDLSVLGPLFGIPAGVTLGMFGSYSQQKNDPEVQDVKAYGTMYLGNAGEDDVVDYHVEKQTPFTKRDAFLGVPFGSADNFSVSGEGIGGGFRLYNKKPGQFRPNKVHSGTVIANASFQIHAGPTNLGIGAALKGGGQSVDIEPWLSGGYEYSFAGTALEDEGTFFRMNNDLGGSVTYAADDNAVKAQLSSGAPLLTASEATIMNDGRRSGRASFVSYSKVGDLKKVVGRGIYRPNLVYLEDNNFPAYWYLNQLPDNAIGEVSITNPSGGRYTYGLPVIASDEKQLQYGLSEVGHTKINDLAYASVSPEYAPVVVGEESQKPYASQFLLTAITTPDYVDRTHDGCTSDDFGGWVRFTYNTTATAGSYYKWRVPYRGLKYNRNTLSDKKDDMGSFSAGKKSVMYLSSIESKTHVALFITDQGSWYYKNSAVKANGSPFGIGWQYLPGSNTKRKDGYPAVADEKIAAGSQTASTAGTVSQNSNPMRRLEKIELWSKDENGNLKEKLQTVHFEYDPDYALCSQLPNSYGNVGKLTLRRVFFEYNGVVNAKISPYIFGYEYKKSTYYDKLPSMLKDKYLDILDDYDALTGADQNPDYGTHIVDRWGYYQRDDNATRFKNMIPWVNQSPPSNFDPAAWNLKWIRLPSGGEIHVHYEQNDYAVVQDKVAMVMVPMESGNLTTDKYYLDVPAALGTLTTAQKQELGKAMHRQFVEKGEKLYFKVLHSIDGAALSVGGGGVTSLAPNKAEYVTGYAKLEDAGYDAGSGKLFIDIKPGDYSAPSDVCADFIRKNIGTPGIGERLEYPSESAESNVKSLLGTMSDADAGRINPSTITYTPPAAPPNSGVISYPHSWVRIPIGYENDADENGERTYTIVVPKKGGGIRVKRVLTYDPGINTAGVYEGQIFGSEYIYRMPGATGHTSGVATNEPGEGRDENVLVKLMDRRYDDSWLNKVIAGADKEQFEGPIGETLLPGPSVAYSRVVVKNIHSGKTNPGFTINEYYTAKDFPFQCIYGPNEVGEDRVTEITSPPQLPIFILLPFLSVCKTEVKALQGYSFVLNNMHGQTKRVSTYGGDYTKPDEWIESSSTETIYFKPGSQIPISDQYNTATTFTGADLGKEMEIVSEGRAITDIGIDVEGKFDGSISFIPSLPFILLFGTVGGSVSYSDSRLKTHVTNKVVRYPAVVSKVINRKDGIEQTTENLAFNPLTGDPTVTMTTDGYYKLDLEKGLGSGPGTHRKVYRTYSYPAALEYREMGQKAANEGAVIKSTPDMTIEKSYGNGKHYILLKYNTPGAVCDAGDFLTPGDYVRLYPLNGSLQPLPDRMVGDYNVESIIGNKVILQPHSNTGGLYFLPGVPLNVKILRSGRTNQLTAPRAGITTYDLDIP